MKSAPGSLATLGSSAKARVILVVWCKQCHYEVEPDPAEQAERYGAETSLLDWTARLRCSGCGSGEIDMIVTGAR